MWKRQLICDRQRPDVRRSVAGAFAIDHRICSNLQHRAAPFHGGAKLRQTQQFVVVFSVADGRGVPW